MKKVLRKVLNVFANIDSNMGAFLAMYNIPGTAPAYHICEYYFGNGM